MLKNDINSLHKPVNRINIGSPAILSSTYGHTMTHPKTEALLKKINYIEADVEIQKQILFSIPSDQQKEMEKTISLIAARKKEIELLRQELKKIDPVEYDLIVRFENTLTEFKKIAAENPFQSVVNRNVHEQCYFTFARR